MLKAALLHKALLHAGTLEVISKLGLWPKVEEGFLFKPQEY
jgi:hypothetical protein